MQCSYGSNSLGRTYILKIYSIQSTVQVRGGGGKHKTTPIRGRGCAIPAKSSHASESRPQSRLSKRLEAVFFSRSISKAINTFNSSSALQSQLLHLAGSYQSPISYLQLPFSWFYRNLSTRHHGLTLLTSKLRQTQPLCVCTMFLSSTKIPELDEQTLDWHKIHDKSCRRRITMARASSRHRSRKTEEHAHHSGREGLGEQHHWVWH